MPSSPRQRKFRKDLWKRNPTCFVCTRKIETYSECTLEHVIPKSLGGTNKKRNLTISHRYCNQKRGNIGCRLVWETIDYREKIKATPVDPVTHLTPAEIQFKNLVKAWKVKLRQQYLDRPRRKARSTQSNTCN